MFYGSSCVLSGAEDHCQGRLKEINFDLVFSSSHTLLQKICFRFLKSMPVNR